MSMRDVLEYRAADSDVVSMSLDDLPRTARTFYARPWGETEWGYLSGEMYWDEAYSASHVCAPIQTKGSQDA
jgi:hypothetical protein